MPARRFTRETIRWRECEYCGNKFPDSRKNRRYDKASCRVGALRAKRRLDAIERRGGQCQDCGQKYDSNFPYPFFILQDGTVLCRYDFSRRSREKRQKR